MNENVEVRAKLLNNFFCNLTLITVKGTFLVVAKKDFTGFLTFL